MSGHNKGADLRFAEGFGKADIQRKVDYFRERQTFRNQTVQTKKLQQFNLPKFVTTPRRPGMRGK